MGVFLVFGTPSLVPLAENETHAICGVFGLPLFVPPCRKRKTRPVCVCFFFGTPSAVPVALNT